MGGISCKGKLEEGGVVGVSQSAAPSSGKRELKGPTRF